MSAHDTDPVSDQRRILESIEMPELAQSVIACPSCGFEGQMTVWTALSDALTPGAVERLIEGTLFDYTCPTCGEQVFSAYPCLYNDREHKAMVRLTYADQIAEAADAIDGVDDGEFKRLGDALGYRIRLTHQPDTLREKAVIFRDGLDDRVMEYLKASLVAAYAEDGSLSGDEVAYYWGLDDRDDMIVAFFDEGRSTDQAHISREAYDEAEEALEAGGYLEEEPYVVDADWAADILDELTVF